MTITIDTLMKKLFTTFFVLIALSMTHISVANDPLPVDKAFPQVVNISENMISVKFFMRDQYYLYKHAFKFETQSEGITLNDPIIPPAKEKYDEFLGDVEVFEAPVEILIPYSSTPGSTGRNFVLTYAFQGCLTDSICYPPTKKMISASPGAMATFVGTPIPQEEIAIEKTGNESTDSEEYADIDAIPEFTQTTSSKQDSEINDLLSGLGTPDFGGSDNSNYVAGSDEILPVDEAFQLSLDVNNNGFLTANWFIEKGYYLYQDKLTFSSSNPAIQLGQPIYPQAKEKYDEIFGDTLAYYNQANIRIPILARPEGTTKFDIIAKYQGCKENSICYPPSETQLPVRLAAGGAVADLSNLDTIDNELNNNLTPANNPTSNLSETDRIAQGISNNSLLSSVFKFLLFGLALTFTPCVLPMLPILSGIITGTGEKEISSSKAFVLSVIYVLAMALVFTVIGVIAAKLGQNLQAAFQNPIVIIVFSLLFVALALSMFGLYELQMPSSIQNKLTQISNQQESGSYYGAAIMGALSALIVGPCVTPPLIGAITVIAETGDTVRGGASMFALALGMGIPMILFGTALGGLVPKAGGWMDQVKNFFGVLMLGLAVWMLARILPSNVTLFLWSLVAALTAVVFGVFKQQESGNLLSHAFKALGVLALVYAAALLIGAISNGKDPLKPLAGLSLGTSAEEHHLDFKRIKSVDDLEQAIAQAQQQQQNVFLDFYADWCVACLEMEKYTFSDKKVQDGFADWVLLQADVTKNDDLDKALMAKLNIVGPPAMLFYDKNGQEVKSSRLFGFKKPNEFLPYLQNLN